MKPAAPTPAALRVSSLPGLAPLGPWQLALAHDRPDHLLIWITRGQGRTLLNGAQSGFGPHSLIFIPAGSLFSLATGPQVLGHALVIPPGTAQAALPGLPDTPHLIRITNATDQAPLTALFEEMSRERREKAPFWQDALLARAVLTGIQLQRFAETPARPSAAERLIRAYCDRISSGYQSGATMAGHAAALGVTPTHLTRMCKSRTGRTAANLLAERIAHAAHTLLCNSDIPVKEISAQLGFANASNFNRFVLRHFKSPPRALRKA